MITRSPMGTLAAKPTLVGGNVSSDETSDMAQNPPRDSKLRLSIEKKIENIWLESQELGSSYNDFVGHMLEVLVVLNCRAFFPKVTPQSQALNNATPPLLRKTG
jgi:hypothetical protein